MHGRVARVSQHEKVTRQDVKDQLQRHSRVSAAEDCCVGCLANSRQGLPHLGIDAAGDGGTHCKALVALLEQLQRVLGGQRRIRGGSHAVGADESQGIGSTRHGGRHVHLGCEELGLLRRRPIELHLACLELVHSALNLELTGTSELPDGFAELQEEVDGVENIHLHRRRRDVCSALGGPTELLGSLGSDGSQALQESLQGAAWSLGGGSLFRGEVRASSPCQGSAVRVAHDDDEPAAELSHAELQAPDKATFGMRASIAGIAQHEQITGGCVKDRLDWRTRVGTADDRSVWSLALVHQSLPHVLRGGRCSRRSCGVPLVARLQQFQRLLRRHGGRFGGPDSARRRFLDQDRRRQRGLGLDQRRLVWGGPQEFHLACLQLIDATMDLELATLDLLSEALAVLQQEIHCLEDVHLHGVGRHLLILRGSTKLCRCEFCNGAEVVQQAFQRRCSGLLRGQFCIEEALRGTVDSAALRVTQDQNQAAAQLAGCELEAADHAAFCVSAGVARVSEDKDVSGHGIEDLFQRRTAVSTADDGRVRGLALLHQQVSHLSVRPDCLWSALHKTFVAFLQKLKRL
mmetsp:Transcript_38338/g.68559  ORF Transcript_38338/g.68559 Transcript_38338/m.68559 type:complete len:575 (+) Transcript_38338:530-2254(+)